MSLVADQIATSEIVSASGLPVGGEVVATPQLVARHLTRPAIVAKPASDATTTVQDALEARAARGRGWIDSLAWLTRPRRVLLLLSAVWVLNAFDLGYTMLESTRQHFVELNPVASALLKGPDHWIVAYKAGLVLCGSSILLALRRFALAECSCWLLFFAYCYVGGLWSRYYQELLITLCDPTQASMLMQSP